MFLLYKLYIGVCGKPKIFIISLFFCINYFVYAYFGAVILNIVQPEYEVSLGMYQRSDLFFKVWLFCILGFFMVVLGMVLDQLLFDRQFLFTKLQTKMLTKPFLANKENAYVRLIIIFFMAIAVLLLLLYRQKLGGGHAIHIDVGFDADISKSNIEILCEAYKLILKLKNRIQLNLMI